jgi:hypothetical protein
VDRILYQTYQLPIFTNCFPVINLKLPSHLFGFHDFRFPKDITEHSPSSGNNSRSGVQEISRLLWNPNIHYCVHKSIGWFPSRIRLIYSTTSHHISLRSTLILSSHPRPSFTSGLFHQLIPWAFDSYLPDRKNTYYRTKIFKSHKISELSQLGLIHSHNRMSLWPTLILSSHLLLRLTSGLFPYVFSTEV